MSKPQSSNQGFLGTCIGVIFNPVPTMRTIVSRRPIGWALIVIVVISFAQAITASASIDQSNFDDVDWVQGPLQGFSIVGGPTLAIAAVAFLTAICWITSRILGERDRTEASSPDSGSPTYPLYSPFPSHSPPSSWTTSARLSPG